MSGPSATRLTVTQQFPAAGRRAETNSTVTIQISTGPVTATELPGRVPVGRRPGRRMLASRYGSPAEVRERRAESTAGRSNPVNTSSSRTARAPSSERAKTPSAGKAKQSPKASKGSKPGKANAPIAQVPSTLRQPGLTGGLQHSPSSSSG